MSAIARFGPALARSVFIQQQTRHMASASASPEPIQKLFLEKIREFKNSNKGLDETHKRMLDDEMMRLKRVHNIEDENKLTQLDHKFESEHNVALYDIDSSKELRQKIQSGEYQKQVSAQSVAKSELLESIPEQVTHEFHLPPLNKPDPELAIQQCGPPNPVKVGEVRPDYEYTGPAKITPEQIERQMLVKFSDDMPTIHDDKKPQRDAVNFPRQPPLLDTPPTRYHVIPESWFQFFYPKTGVTGPYLFAGAFTTFLLSKEWLVMEHELLGATSSIVIFAYAIPKFGPKVRDYIMKGHQATIDGWDNWQKGNAAALGELIEEYKQSMNCGDVIKELYEARKQEIDLQLEGEYRNRLKKVYDDTKRRLNYLVAVADSQRQIHHHHMVNWVISNVHSSFGPKQESEVLDNCIMNLKQLASKNANVI
jgi:F-type H+-transporting ATPase subunit b